MPAYDDITSRLDYQQLAQQVGADPVEVEQAIHQVLPALLGGLQANAADPASATPLINAIEHHDNGLADGVNGLVNFADVDTDDGAKITRHVFGDNTDAVISQLGGVGGGNSGLVAKLLPILAPIVLSYLAKQMGQSGGSGGAGGGILGSILGSILSGAASGSGGSSGGGLGDILGGLLGGGTRH